MVFALFAMAWFLSWLLQHGFCLGCYGMVFVLVATAWCLFVAMVWYLFVAMVWCLFVATAWCLFGCCSVVFGCHSIVLVAAVLFLVVL